MADKASSEVQGRLTVHPEAARSWQLLVDVLEAEQDPIRKRNLAIVAQHVVAEVAGDLAALEATLVEEPRYTFLGGAAPRRLSNMEEVRSFYEESIGIGKNRLAFDISRVLVDQSTVITEGIFRHVMRGSDLAGRTLSDGQALSPSERYLTSYRALVVWPISAEGLIAGEEIYLGEPHQVERAVADGEYPFLGLPQ
jgi:hypothetical protein